MDTTQDKVYPLSEVSQMLGIPRSTLSRWARNGQINARKYGADWRMTAEAIEHLRTHGTDPAKEKGE